MCRDVKEGKEPIVLTKRGVAITIGFFDGVHRGHRYLLKRLEDYAAAKGLRPTVVTFDHHPRSVVQEGYHPSLLTISEEKLSLLSEAFDGDVVVLPFTRELGEMSAMEFMRNILHDKLNTKLLLMGYNHLFGHGGGKPEDYIRWGAEIGIDVLRVDALGGERISSSRIRTLIGEGDIKHANAMLGYRYYMTGEVTGGMQIGRTIGFPTANLLLPKEKLLPSCGVYAVRVIMPDGNQSGGMLCIGHRPTIETDGEVSVEVHILNFSGNLYGQRLRVEFEERLRDERPFSSMEELRSQLEKDAEQTAELLGGKR